jgi:hypothetical protein
LGRVEDGIGGWRFDMGSEMRADGRGERGSGDRKGAGAGYWKRFLFGVAVMAAVFSGLLFALYHLDLMPGAGEDYGTAPPRIEVFEASPAVVGPGEGSTLRWKITGISLADEVAIEPGIGAVAREGRLVVLPEETTTFTISAANAAGSAEARATVEVLGL